MATWDEVDLDSRIWTAPKEHMKGDREHRVPLGERELEILRLMQKVRSSDFIFPGAKRGRPLSNMSMEMV